MTCNCDQLEASLNKILAAVNGLKETINDLENKVAKLEKEGIKKDSFLDLVKGAIAQKLIGDAILGVVGSGMGVPLPQLRAVGQVVQNLAPFAEPGVFTAIKKQGLDLAGTQKDLEAFKKLQDQRFTTIKKETLKTVQTEVVEKLDRSIEAKLKNVSRTANTALSTAQSAASTATAASAQAAAAIAQAAAIAAQLAALAGTVASLAVTAVLANELRRAINNARAELQRESKYLTDLILLNQKRAIARDAQLKAELTTDIKGLGQKVSQLSTKVRTNTSAIAANKSAIGANTRTINRVWTDVKTNTRTITQVQTQTQTNTRTITDLQSATRSHTQAIKSLTTATSTNTRTITQIQQQLRDVPKIIKVPQPYPVTKTQIVKVPQPYPVTKTVIKEVPKPYPVTQTKIQKVTEKIPFIQTRVIERTKIQKVTVPATNTTTKLSTSDLTKIGSAACTAVKTCNPDSERLKRIEDKLGEPFATPETLLNDGKDSPIQHQSFASIMSWWIRQMDALIGEFPIKLEIEA